MISHLKIDEKCETDLIVGQFHGPVNSAETGGNRFKPKVVLIYYDYYYCKQMQQCNVVKRAWVNLCPLPRLGKWDVCYIIFVI